MSKNRKQRRIEKSFLKSLPAHKRLGFYEVCVTSGVGIADGERITIDGVKRNKDGTFTSNCKTGEETVFTARIMEAN